MGRMARYPVPLDAARIIGLVAELRIAGLVVDVEPFVTSWDVTRAEFAQRAVALQEAIAQGAPSVRELVFASNSSRAGTLSIPARPPKTALEPNARKPWRIAYLGELPRPIAVIGDQVLTDGLLAWRLGAAFLHLPTAVSAPWYPRAQAAGGRPLAHLFFVTCPPGR
ncbi:hypothetical protein [Actinomadura sp. 3N508]|uniref:hypothetical protein n=1 Tax=Actinomadura sp. 3N508 TaxID=3375153 RepID=UPI0037A0F3AD